MKPEIISDRVSPKLGCSLDRIEAKGCRLCQFDNGLAVADVTLILLLTFHGIVFIVHSQRKMFMIIDLA